MSDNQKIESADQFKRLMEERGGPDTEDQQLRYDHIAVSTQAIKTINSIKMDEFVKKVMTLRILGPILTGKERAHISIALELGASIDDVIQAEQYGIQVVTKLLEKIDAPEFVEKFNRDQAVEDAVKRLGNSAKAES